MTSFLVRPQTLLARSQGPWRRGLSRLAAALGLLLSAGAAPVMAQTPAPTLPPPDSVHLDRLAYMSTFPPEGAQRVDQSNAYKYPQLRWVVQHLRELQPTRNIRRGGASASALPADPKPLGALQFEDAKGQKISLEAWAQSTYTDALLVLHRGRVVYERYDNQMQPSSPHLLFSVTKSFTGLMAAQLAHEGRLDPQALVTRYVPELAGSAWGDMKVREVMDMTGAVRFRENYTDPSSEIFGYAWASGLLPRPAGYQGAGNVYDFLKTLPKDGEHGQAFTYRTVHSEVLGWIVSRVTGQHWADLMSQQLWQKMGMEEDAYVMVDSVGTPLQGAGLNATARDLARVGEMLRLGGRFNGQKIFDAAVIEDTARGGDRERFKAGGLQAARPGYSYRNQWWVLHNADGAYEAAGVHGQFIHINPAAQMVVIKLSSHPVAGAAFTHATTLKAWAALAQALR
ncbi:serine hydrolase [Curvibacter sp. RS43]|uniref:serine hydrolase domain-containing protein n=1 Tax=Curvibacter microcysteis TaxID=3026419 RepID=UPI0023609168|nr:serine hydrolase [Curvibacter sp. RS43]MDD0812760.1 serine hydrolase [Curvibacter sp. RS43]